MKNWYWKYEGGNYIRWIIRDGLVWLDMSLKKPKELHNKGRTEQAEGKQVRGGCSLLSWRCWGPGLRWWQILDLNSFTFCIFQTKNKVLSGPSSTQVKNFKSSRKSNFLSKKMRINNAWKHKISKNHTENRLSSLFLSSLFRNLGTSWLVWAAAWRKIIRAKQGVGTNFPLGTNYPHWWA